MNSKGLNASRVPPPRVEPIVIDGVRYTQVAGNLSVDGQMGGMLAAFDASTGGEALWTLKVYDNRRLVAELEGDGQDVFFRSMAVDLDGRLRIVNERGGIFLVDVTTRNVTAAGEVRRVHPNGLQFMPEPPA